MRISDTVYFEDQNDIDPKYNPTEDAIISAQNLARELQFGTEIKDSDTLSALRSLACIFSNKEKNGGNNDVSITENFPSN